MDVDNSIIKITFQLPNEENYIYQIQNSLNFNINYICPEAKISNTSYAYSGRHDHGPLPQLKSNGPMLPVISALAQVKEISDSFLTTRINQVYGYASKDTNANVDGMNEENEIEAEAEDENADVVEAEMRQIKKTRIEASDGEMTH
jgi:hypothetical protein